MQNSIAIITSIIGLLIGGGGVGVLFYKEKKKSLSLQNEESATNIWKRLFDELQEQNVALQAKSDKKDDKIDKLYRDIYKLQEANNALTTENALLRFQKCLVHNCDKREPPSK